MSIAFRISRLLSPVACLSASLLLATTFGASSACWGQSSGASPEAVRLRLASFLQVGEGAKPAGTVSEPAPTTGPTLAPRLPTNPPAVEAPEAPVAIAAAAAPEASEAFEAPAVSDVPAEAVTPVALSEQVPAEEPPLIPQPIDRELALPSGTGLPCSSRVRCGFQCNNCDARGPLGWGGAYMIPWEVFAQGEYVGPARTAHVPEYRLRVDDLLDFVYIFSFKATPQPYRLHVRDRILIQSVTAGQTIDQEVFVQPDGTLSLRLLGQVRAVGLTLEELRADLEKAYQPFVQKPSITVTPLELNSHLQELRAAVDRRYGAAGGQGSQVRVTPAGTIQLPIIGSVSVQGLTLAELKREIEERYAKVTEGVEITPILVARAPRFFYVVGEVRVPGRYEMQGPTTVLQAIAMAGSWNNGAHLKHVVVFRRDENWCLMATKLDLYGALHGTRPCPADEIWLRDSDLIIVPKSPVLVADDFIELVFTRGVYGVFPMVYNVNFAKLSTL